MDLMPFALGPLEAILSFFFSFMRECFEVGSLKFVFG